MKLLKKKNLLYYIGLIGIPTLGIVMKNILFQSFILGKSMYRISLATGIKQTWKYWLFYLAVTMLFMSVSLLCNKETVRKAYVLGMDIIITSLIYCDLIYNRSFYTMPSAANIPMLTNFEGMEGGEVTSLLSKYDILLFIDILILILYIIKIKKKAGSDEVVEKKILKKTYMALTIVSGLIIIAIPMKNFVFGSEDKVYKKIYTDNNANKQAKYFTAVGFHVKDIYDLMMNNVFDNITDEESEMINDYYGNKDSNYHDTYEGIYKGKNVIFLQIESLESFVVENEIEGQEITPNINKLANKGLLFNHIYEEVQCGNSSDADLMYTTSILPATRGCTFYRYSDIQLNSLPRMLSEKGYSTEYHQAISNTFWNYKEAWKGMIGVDDFYGIDTYNMDEKVGFTLSDKSFLDQTYESLRKKYGDGKTNYYAHIVCNSSHMPFEISNKYKNLELSDELDDNYLGKYMQCVSYVDECIGEFISNLDKSGMLNNTIVVIIGDHTGVHKYYEDKISKLYSEYPWCDVDGNYTVPLIIYSKNVDYTKMDSYDSYICGQQIDVMPTLAYLLGIDENEYKNSAMGKNLFDQSKNYALFRDGQVFGECDEETEERVKKSYDVSDILYRALKQ